MQTVPQGLALQVYFCCRGRHRDAGRFAMACGDKRALALIKHGYLLKSALLREYKAIQLIVHHLSGGQKQLLPLADERAERWRLGFRLRLSVGDDRVLTAMLCAKSSAYGCDDALIRLVVTTALGKPTRQQGYLRFFVAAEQTMQLSTIGGPQIYHELPADDIIYDIRFKVTEGNLCFGFLGSSDSPSGSIAIAERYDDAGWWHFPCFTWETALPTVPKSTLNLKLQTDRPFCRIEIRYKTCAVDCYYRDRLVQESRTLPSNLPSARGGLVMIRCQEGCFTPMSPPDYRVVRPEFPPPPFPYHDSAAFTWLTLNA